VVVKKTRDILGLVAAGAFLALAILFPGVIQDIPNWGWLIICVGFFGACVVGLWRQGELGTVAKRGGIALLLFIPFITLISVLPGEPQRDLSLPLVIGLIVLPLSVLFAIALRTGFFEGLKEMFASHPAACEQCFAPRKDLIWVESAADAPDARGKRRSLCPDCVWNELETQLASLSSRLLVAEPVRNAGGYYSLDRDGITEWWASEDSRADKETTTRRVLDAVGIWLTRYPVDARTVTMWMRMSA
jgi:hypothetical protein